VAKRHRAGWGKKKGKEKHMRKGGKRGKPQQQNAGRTKAGKVGESISDFDTWRYIAREVIPGEKDEWKIGEVACLLQQFATYIGQNYRQIDNDIDETQKKAISFNIPCEIDRANTPPEVYVGIKWSKKFGDGGTVKVPDPSQRELPFTVDHKAKGPAADEAPAGSVEEEESDPKVVAGE
jgi:hypothetical protein